jgi:DNA-directed RNA polymerase subunit beta'
MRTFHTGGIAGLDITSGLPRVEELFEARVPKGAALLADIDGLVSLESGEDGRILRVVSREEYSEDYAIPEDAQLLVEDGEYVEPGMILAQRPVPLAEPQEGDYAPEGEGQDGEGAAPTTEEIVANIGGNVVLGPDSLSIVWEDVEEREHIILAASRVLVEDGQQIRAGDALTAGPLNPHDILHIRGKDELQRYLVDEVQRVYISQGVNIHDKHIEIILRQMLRRVSVESTGDTEYIPGQMVDKFEFQDKNGQVLAEGGEPATAKPIFLGITRASLLTDSFLAAASFQETTRVLTQAAVSGAHDWLLGLKENVIIGRLIPARVETPGMQEILAPQPPPELAEMVPAGWLDGPEGPDGDAFGFDPQSRKPEEEVLFFADGGPVLEGDQDLGPQFANGSNGSEHSSVDDSGTEAAQSEPPPEPHSEPTSSPEQPEEEVPAQD